MPRHAVVFPLCSIAPLSTDRPISQIILSSTSLLSVICRLSTPCIIFFTSAPSTSLRLLYTSFFSFTPSRQCLAHFPRTPMPFVPVSVALGTGPLRHLLQQLGLYNLIHDVPILQLSTPALSHRLTPTPFVPVGVALRTGPLPHLSQQLSLYNLNHDVPILQPSTPALSHHLPLHARVQYRPLGRQLLAHTGARLLSSESYKWCCKLGTKLLAPLPPLPPRLQHLCTNQPTVLNNISRRLNYLFCLSAIGASGQFTEYHGQSIFSASFGHVRRRYLSQAMVRITLLSPDAHTTESSPRSVQIIPRIGSFMMHRLLLTVQLLQMFLSRF